MLDRAAAAAPGYERVERVIARFAETVEVTKPAPP
jgi:hypothetical protein